MRRALCRPGVILAALLVIVAVTVLALVVPASGFADTISNISPASPIQAGGWMGRYPISRYQIDEYFPAISVSLFSGVSVSGLMPMVAYAAAQVIWLITAFISNTVITVFQYSFGLNLLTGEHGTGGALAPVAEAIHNIYSSTFGQPWLIAAITAVGAWAMWKALVQRRYAQTTAALLTSLAYCLLALGIVARPAQTITPLSQISNQISAAFLSLTSNGTVSNGEAAAQSSSGQLFRTLVLDPWTVLEFGGIDHCVNTANQSVAVQPLSRDGSENAALASKLEEGTEVQAEGKQCIDNRNKYAPHFLAYPFQSAGRNAEYEALKAGEDSKLPSSDPAKNNGTYPLGAADKPAAEASGKGGQYERLLLAILIFAGELGIWILLAGLAAGVILAQILLLLLLAFAPVALVAAVFPGRGHAFFIGWGTRILGYLSRKAAYSLILAILLAVCQALMDATSSLGWLMSFLLQAAFMWTVLLQRHRLTSDLLHTITCSTVSEEAGISRLQTLYYASRLTRLPRLHRHEAPETASPAAPTTTPPAAEPAAPTPLQGPVPPARSPRSSVTPTRSGANPRAASRSAAGNRVEQRASKSVAGKPGEQAAPRATAGHAAKQPSPATPTRAASTESPRQSLGEEPAGKPAAQQRDLAEQSRPPGRKRSGPLTASNIEPPPVASRTPTRVPRKPPVPPPPAVSVSRSRPPGRSQVGAAGGVSRPAVKSSAGVADGPASTTTTTSSPQQERGSETEGS